MSKNGDDNDDGQHDGRKQKGKDEGGSSKKEKGKDAKEDGRTADANKDGDDEDGKNKGEDDQQGGKKRRWPIVVLVHVLILAVAGGTLYWYLTRNEEDTDDAYTEGNAVSIAPKVSGYVVERLVDDNTFVHPGDLMLRIDPARLHHRAGPGSGQPCTGAGAAAQRADRPRDLARALSVRPRAGPGATGAGAGQSGRRQAGSISGSTPSTSAPPRRRRSTRRRRSSNPPRPLPSRCRRSSASASLVPQNIATTSSMLKQRQAQVAQAQASLAQGRAEPVLHRDTRAAGGQGDAAQRRRRHLRAGRPAGVLRGGDADLGGSQLQGNPAEPHAARPARHHQGGTPIPC